MSLHARPHEGDDWTSDQLRELKAARFTPGGWLRFLGASVERAARQRAERPHARRQVAIMSAAGLGAAAIVAFASFPLLAFGFGVWWLGVALMVLWHLGLLVTPDGRALDRLGTANLVTIGRSAAVPLLPFLRPSGVLVALALAAASDVVDGPVARARREVTRLGTWLDASVDSLVLASALVAGARLELLSPVPLALGLARALLPWPVLLTAAFVRGRPGPIARVPFGRTSGAAIIAGIAAGAVGVAAASVVVGAASLLGLAGMVASLLASGTTPGSDETKAVRDTDAPQDAGSHPTTYVGPRSSAYDTATADVRPSRARRALHPRVGTSRRAEGGTP